VELTGHRPDAAQNSGVRPVLTRTQAEYTGRTSASEGVHPVANPSHWTRTGRVRCQLHQRPVHTKTPLTTPN